MTCGGVGTPVDQIIKLVYSCSNIIFLFIPLLYVEQWQQLLMFLCSIECIHVNMMIVISNRPLILQPTSPSIGCWKGSKNYIERYISKYSVTMKYFIKPYRTNHALFLLKSVLGIYTMSFVW